MSLSNAHTGLFRFYSLIIKTPSSLNVMLRFPVAYLIIQFLYDCSTAVGSHATLDGRIVKQSQNNLINIA